MTLIESPELRLALGTFSSIFGLIGYYPYFRDIFRGKTKPHAFTWLIWALLTGIAYAAQISDNAGPGSWIILISAICCTCIFILALFVGSKEYTSFDWICLIVSLLGIPLWLITETPFWSVILITLVDCIGSLPTLRKAWQKPHEETASTFLISSLKFIPAVLALNHFSVITALYPGSLVINNLVIFGCIKIRGKKLSVAE